MKLSDWAKQNGLSYRTAHRLFQSGKFPCRTEQLATGTILVYPDAPKNEEVALYARVSSHDQKEDLARQLVRLRDYAATHGLRIKTERSEIGSGLNGRRKALVALLKDPTVTTLVVEHRDRLTRFGFEYTEAAMKASGRRLLVMNETEDKTDLVQDFVDVVTSMCARIYGRRSARNRAKRALKAAEK